MSRRLSEVIEANERLWATMTADERARGKQQFVNEGWRICTHPDCPPWDCKITNPPDPTQPARSNA